MLKVGDMVKVISQDEILTIHNVNTIGYIGKITKINKTNSYELDNGYWYGEEELEKGYLEWIKDE